MIPQDGMTPWKFSCPVEQEERFLPKEEYRGQIRNDLPFFTCPVCGSPIEFDMDWLRNFPAHEGTLYD